MPERGLMWAMDPPHARLFLFFLVIVSLITLVRGVRLAWMLFAMPGRERISIEHVITQQVDPNRLAVSALAGAISHKGPSNGPSAIARDEVRRTLRMANARFNYRWRLSQARVVATKGLLRLTLVVSLANACYGAYPDFEFAHNDTNRNAYSAWFEVGYQLLTQLGIGLTACIALSCVHQFFEGRLIRRKASWRLFRATALHALSRGASR